MIQETEFKILLVDDDRHVLEALELLFEDSYSILTAKSGQDAIDIASKDFNIAVVVMDIKMPGMDGIEAARKIREISPDTPVIFHTGFPGEYTEEDIDQKESPYEYIQKGSSISKLKRAVRNGIEAYRHRKGIPTKLFNSEISFGMVGKSAKMKEIYRKILKVAVTDSKVMILGETGTGKELVSKAIHNFSRRRDENLVIFNCNRKAPDLVESELFGHGKGSFTGAIEDRIGLFEYADGGTVLLDEIGDLDDNTQIKVLRVIDSGEFQTIGEKPVLKKTDVRVICATHHDLEKLVESGKFREDLYYRLNGVVIKLPPLRERKEDIPDIISMCVNKLMGEEDLMPKYFDPSAIEILLQQDWPGNVRQLIQTIESLVIEVDSDIILAQDVETYFGHKNCLPKNLNSLAEKTIEFRKNCIITALHETNKNINAAARLLSIDPANLRKLIKSYHITLG